MTFHPAVHPRTGENSRLFCGFLYEVYARFYKQQNDFHRAQEQMNKAIAIMQDCEADGWVERYEKQLAELV